jgi:hypothetical protein
MTVFCNRAQREPVGAKQGRKQKQKAGDKRNKRQWKRPCRIKEEASVKK